MPHFADAFGDRLKVVVFEEYRQRLTEVLREVCEHLQVDSDVAFDTSAEVNRGGVPRSRFFTVGMNAVRSSPSAVRAAKRFVPDDIRERIRRTNLERPKASTSTMDALRREFRSDVDAVESVLGRRIEAWQ